MLDSQRKSIKSVSKWHYMLEMLEDRKGVYHVVITDKLTNTIRTISLVDYGMASHAFDLKLNSFEGMN